jgi:hypothetical protein
MTERLLSVAFVAGWTLFGMFRTLDSGQPDWWGALVGGSIAALFVGM